MDAYVGAPFETATSYRGILKRNAYLNRRCISPGGDGSLSELTGSLD